MARPAVHAPPQPLVIYATPGFDSYTYELEPLAAKRMRSEGATLPSRITVAFDASHVESAAHDPIVAQAVALLTGQSLDALTAAGGVEVWHSRNGKLLWQWPRGPR